LKLAELLFTPQGQFMQYGLRARPYGYHNNDYNNDNNNNINNNNNNNDNVVTMGM
jgi:hypothetical protein